MIKPFIKILNIKQFMFYVITFKIFKKSKMIKLLIYIGLFVFNLFKFFFFFEIFSTINNS